MTYRRWLATIFALLLTTAVAILLCVIFACRLVRGPDVPHLFGDASLWTQEQPFLLHDRHCDVLAYGDSTAATGFDPRVVTAKTGLTACNIAATRPVVDYLDTLPIDVFLAHNPKPKVLVLQFGPEVFYRKPGWDHDSPFVPLSLMLRDMPASYWLPRMLRHIPETTHFALFTTQFALTRKPLSEATERQFASAIETYEASNGLLVLGLKPIVECTSPPLKLEGPLDTKWIAGLRGRYEALGIHVVLRAAPLPACDPQFAQFQHDLAPWMDVNVEALPLGYFESGARHTTPEGAAAETQEIAALVAAKAR